MAAAELADLSGSDGDGGGAGGTIAALGVMAGLGYGGYRLVQTWRAKSAP